MGSDAKHFWRGAVSMGALLGATAGGQAMAQAQAQKEAPGASQSVEEIIVTASRRETTVRKTPIAISAYGGAELQREHVQTFADLTTQSPNIQFGSNGGNTDIAIRGIGTNLQTAGNDPGVAFHADGVYVADPALALVTLLDVNRVEVLRGPQGTLFGRNATGGAVNIIANTPTTSPSFGIGLSAGVPGGEHVDAFASGPLDSSGTLLARASVEQSYARGTTDNVGPSRPRRLDDKNDVAARLQLEWRPADNFHARAMGEYKRSDTAGTPYYLVGTPNSAAGLPSQLIGTFLGNPADGRIAVDQGDAKLTEKSVALFLDWDIGGGSLRATVSKRRTDNDRAYDGDGTAVDYTSTLVTQHRDTDYAELLYSSDDSKRLSFILGANYFHDRETQEVVVPVIGFPAPVTLDGDVGTRSLAVFGHIQFKLTEAWKVFGGARYSTDRKQAADSNNFIGSLVQSRHWSKPTFEVGTSYDLGRSSTGYLKYATGYKSGGYSAGSLAPAFAPETNAMVELGLKGTYLNGLIEANAALFHMSYKNLQVNQVVGVSSQVTNAARATIDGAELELVLHPTRDVRLNFDGGWLNARFDNFFTEDSARPALGLLNLKGNSLPQAPKFTLGGGSVYSHTLGDGAKVTLGVRYDWKSRVYFSEFNLPLISQAPNGRLSAYASYDLPGGHWQVGLYGRNLTDAHAYNSMVVDSAVLNSIALATLQPRREFGVELRGHF